MDVVKFHRICLFFVCFELKTNLSLFRSSFVDHESWSLSILSSPLVPLSRLSTSLALYLNFDGSTSINILSQLFFQCVPFVIALAIPLRWVTFIGMLHFSQSVCSYSWCGEQMQIVYAILCRMCVCFCLDCVVWEWVLFKMKISVLVCLRIINDFN